MLKELRSVLLSLIDDIDAGNTNISEEAEIKIIDTIRELTRKDMPMSKYQAYTFLNISRATFDNLVREGKLPKGKKVAGFKELMWFEKDLKDAIKYN